MKAYICDVCKAAITDPYSARMREFWFTVSNSDLYQVPVPTKTKEKIHLCSNCFEGFRSIAKEKAAREQRDAEKDG